MTPGARVAAAIEILDQFAASPSGMADKMLAAWARSHRFAGSKDRAAIGDLVYGALRRWRSAAALGGGETGRARMLGALRGEGRPLAEIAGLFSGEGYAPAALTEAERARLAAPAPQMSDAEAADWPEWLWPELTASVPDPAAEAGAQRRRAPMDLRVNTVKTDVASARAALAEAGIEAVPGPVSPLCLRVDPPRSIQHLEIFRAGWVEPQDAASQAVALLAAAAARRISAGRAPLVVDFCAGGGGKSLALAAALDAVNGEVVAHDIAPERMTDVPVRAGRAGVRINLAESLRGVVKVHGKHLQSRADVVLVDAPCSGSGAWARNPDAKWRLTPERLAALQAMQREALAAAAALVRPGGVLVYATCSLLRAENAEQSTQFLSSSNYGVEPSNVAFPLHFTASALTQDWEAAGLRGLAAVGHEAVWTPFHAKCDGFYTAHLVRAVD